MQYQKLAALFDEVEKIGASWRQAGYMQSRRGIRPLRVDTLLSKSSSDVDNFSDNASPAEAEPPSASYATDEPDDGSAIGKAASAEEPRREKVMKGFAQARPYVVGGIKAGVPAALFGKIMAGEGPAGSKAARIAGVTGAGLGVANEYMKQWAEKNKRKDVAKRLLER